MFEIGEIVGPYRVTGILGSGGMGSVYRVEHTITRRIEAIKVAARGRPGPDAEEQRFLREVQVQASLDHPNIASVHNAFWSSGDLVLAMELVDGTPLADILEHGRLAPAKGVEYLCQVLSALSYAHARGIVHRDVTPANIIICADGRVKLTDFGLARPVRDTKLTHSGVFVGSPYYASPEQVRDREPDARSDLYSLGVILYQILTGRRPYEGEGAFDVMKAHTSPELPKPPIELEPAIGPELNAVVMRALAKDPGDRFQSAGEFRDAVLAAIKGVQFRRPLGSVALGLGRSKSVRLGAGLAAGVIALMAAGAWLSRPRDIPPLRVPAAAASPVIIPMPEVAPPAESGTPAEEIEAQAAEPDEDAASASPDVAPAAAKPSRRPIPVKAVAVQPAEREAVESPAEAVEEPVPVREPPKAEAAAGQATAAAPLSSIPSESAGAVEPPSQPEAEEVAAPEKRRHPIIRALGKVLSPFRRKKRDDAGEEVPK